MSVKARLLFFAIGVISLISSFALLNGEQYFSAIFLLLAVLLPFASMILLALAYSVDDSKDYRTDKKMRLGVALSLICALIIIAETGFVLYNEFYNLGNAVAYLWKPAVTDIGLAIATSLAAYWISMASKSMRNAKLYIFIAVCAIIIAAAATGVKYLSTFTAAKPAGTDELALDYYSARLFLNGSNPYTSSMIPAFSSARTLPTLYLNGTYQNSYIYPALAFLPMLPLAALFDSYSAFLIAAFAISIAIVVAVLAFLFRSGGFSRLILLPAFAIALALYWQTPWSLAKYVLMAALLLAYALRRSALLYPVLLGIAASVHQIAFFVVPFFLVLTLREQGAGRMLSAAIGAAIVFLLINAYFIATTGTQIFRSIIGTGNIWLQPRGTTIMQFLIAFYPVNYGYAAGVVLMAYVAMLAAFYVYKKAMLLMCLAVPAMFMFSSSSSVTYVIPFMPLLLYMMLEHKTEHEGAEPAAKRSGMYAVALAVVFLALFLSLTLYSHTDYLRQHPVNLLNASLSYGPGIFGTVPVSMTLVVQNNMSTEQNLTIYLVTVRPFSSSVLVHTPNLILQPGLTYRLTANLTPYRLLGSAKVKVFVSADHYMSQMRLLP